MNTMLILALAYIGGLLTIFSPCVLPVLPFILARPGEPFRHGGLPILMGMAATFSLLALFASTGGAWLAGINQYGRDAALLSLLALGLVLVFPAWAERLMRPFARIGERLQQRADRMGGIAGSLLLGVAVGFLWAPCAGPILGLLLAGVALKGATLHSALLLLAFAVGAATPLALILLAGEKVFQRMKRMLGAEAWLRRIAGVLVVAATVIVAFGWDARLLSRFSFLGTSQFEQNLVARLKQQAASSSADMPPLSGATQWLNSKPLDRAMLRGKVVLVDFWTYSCINCLRTLPYLEAWDKKYRALGLVIVGVHTPEFAFEKDPGNVARAVRELGIGYPVALDSNYSIWNAFNNQYWPAHYLVDAMGRIREVHFGEGGYSDTEHMIQTLLREAHGGMLAMDTGIVRVAVSGALAADSGMDRSPETYLGYARQENFSSPQRKGQDTTAQYSAPHILNDDQWALQGTWKVTALAITTEMPDAAISYRFRGRDLHLVLGTRDGKPVHFRVTLDGKPPGASHGADTGRDGQGTITEKRLYQLIRLDSSMTGAPHTFRIEFDAPGVQAFAFTFG